MLVLWTSKPSDSSDSLSVPSIAKAIATTLGPGTGGFALAITDRSVPVRPFGVIWAGGTWHTILLGTDDRDDVVCSVVHTAWYAVCNVPFDASVRIAQHVWHSGRDPTNVSCVASHLSIYDVDCRMPARIAQCAYNRRPRNS